MADTALQNAEKRRDEIAAAINQLQAQIEEKRKELERIKTFIADYAVFQSYPSELPLELQKTPSPAPRLRLLNPPRHMVGDKAEKVLLQNGRPMARDELFKAVTRDGMTIQGKDPEMVFSTMLWRMQDRFVRLRPHGYWLTRMPCAAVGYLPSPPLSAPAPEPEPEKPQPWPWGKPKPDTAD
ncbi:hypothetical protein JQ559_30580 [Bradyrhizobium viridifuturi]|uniref:hypothetical protein n=1 Tax=Bradyrhizobium TaxID=374 RepID=UPI0003974F6F|nr:MULTISPECIES: hypothetical protein [Bradyrhizobium]ERF82832.1 MAG: hypothetical protein C207_03950 [Bradyrhizobium sp. DFCI-1]OYU62578.1 MAG: hypothetical protein CFE30_09890 [Bradyrhizobium sp. PARBB1]PSO27660.1 hypothetical protein C7G43_06710 [Bradyrhizobium sp. MOS004]QRI69340.1 hypothetical protein JQ507_31480 [Bradyrhizobium sp. PSBB068]MBR1022322.1 hypothetical protein [Bradyrhizobium viridifuturi]